MIIGDSWSLLKKAYLRPVGRGLSSMGGLGGSNNSSRGSDFMGSSSSSSMNYSASSSRLGSIKCSRDATLSSLIGSGSGHGSVLVFKEWVIDKGSLKFFPRRIFIFLICPSWISLSIGYPIKVQMNHGVFHLDREHIQNSQTRDNVSWRAFQQLCCWG
jgi:hypothetical protein